MEISQGIINFLTYFGAGLGFLVLFGFTYEKFTPYREIELISKGNISAAITFFGALLGFALPVASTIVHSVSLMDLVIWGLIAGLTQKIVFLVARYVFLRKLDLKYEIENNNKAVALFIATMSIIVGIINAASLTY